LEDTNGSLDLDLYASDIDTPVLTFSSLGGVNITVNIDPLTNIVTFIPDPDYFGSESILFTVSDGQYNISDNILVIVIPVNDAPLVDLPVNMTVDEGQNVLFTANVSDIDTPVLNYQWDFNNDGIIDSTLVSPNYIYPDNGTYLVTLTVDDGLNFVNDTMLVYVNDLNPLVNFSFIPFNPNENETVYDPFMGSGTTAKAAILMNRNFIGSEISKEYFDIAEKRLNPYRAQYTLALEI